MYFEDIYNKVAPLWKKEFSLEGIEETETYIQDIRQEHNRVEDIIDFTEKEKYTEWEGMLAFTMYQTLTAFSIDKWKKEKVKSININDISITLFEKYFKENMEPEDEFEGNEEYLKQYKGFRNPPSDITSQ
ncbi:hypothetical protein ACE939_05800 [Aquimarina sp. W85]|uniref:hypothetical protein n=1 Tax=Aquimarina rhodophyticola TaxID=3342246 RepID=UPI00366AC8CE